MLFVIDIGNTHTVLGVFEGERLRQDWRISTDKTKTADEYGVLIAGGQAHLKGRILRLGHLGFYDTGDMFKMVTALEATLLDLNLLESVGQGVAALMNEIREK